ncbi:lipid A biosynthesis acyltransferase [Chitinivorax sp. B]|uniref:lysophospholipid acyltransferase family protein n=1 Tax=Chitinivorax sp. B TaxID=2502235 RepID=UPI0010FA6120|nr:lipid A biosynthesis acyltransferase [Chitinivorax sp. B]
MRVWMVLWRLVSYLPTPIIGILGYGLGWLLFWVGKKTTLRNLELCFPDWTPAERRRVGQRHFMRLTRAALELALHVWQPKQRILKMVKINGWEHLQQCLGQPVIMLNPHFVGLNNGSAAIGERLSESMTLYSRNKNPTVEAFLYQARHRFGQPMLFARQDGLRAIVKHLKRGVPFFYLPDMDFNSKDALFVPFFGVPASTLTMPSRLAAMAGAKVVPVVTRQLSIWQGYEVTFYPAWMHFPSEDPEQDARNINDWLEQRVLEMPDQYYWVHKRFGRRPPGEKNLYK